MSNEIAYLQKKIAEIEHKITALKGASSALDGVDMDVNPYMDGIDQLHVAGTEYDNNKADEIADITEDRDELIKFYKEKPKSVIEEQIRTLTNLKLQLEEDLRVAKEIEAARIAAEKAAARERAVAAERRRNQSR